MDYLPMTVKYRNWICDYNTLRIPVDIRNKMSFINNPLRTDDPADEDTGQQRNEWHQETVADIVHNIKQLSDRTVGQL